ncbi:hypothetical protein BDR26DRAFT_951904 [Obelidium mucronatum]|nr:hypothetical protein BDR26DRAFT_951904 [Obelidium mucronatum]
MQTNALILIFPYLISLLLNLRLAIPNLVKPQSLSPASLLSLCLCCANCFTPFNAWIILLSSLGLIDLHQDKALCLTQAAMIVFGAASSCCFHVLAYSGVVAIICGTYACLPIALNTPFYVVQPSGWKLKSSERAIGSTVVRIEAGEQSIGVKHGKCTSTRSEHEAEMKSPTETVALVESWRDYAAATTIASPTVAAAVIGKRGKEKNLLLQSVAIVVAFIVGWTPFLIRIGMDVVTGHPSSPELDVAALFFAILQELCDPLILDAKELALGAISGHQNEFGQSLLLVTFTIKKAQGLKAKDRAGSSNPYVVVSSQGNVLVFQSVAVKQRIRDTADPITITVWNKSSATASSKDSLLDSLKLKNKQQSADAFLGLVSLSGSTIIQLVSQEEGFLERWFPLDKRSTKSHVSGSVLLEMQDSIKCSNTAGIPLFDLVFDVIPPDPLTAFQSELIRLLESDYKANTATTRFLLSPESLDQLNVLAKYWIIDSCARAVIELEAYKDIYVAGLIKTTAFFNIYSELVKDIEDAYQMNSITTHELSKFQDLGLTIYKKLLDQVSTFFDQDIEAYSPSTSMNDFIALTQHLESLTNHPLLSPAIGSHRPPGQNIQQIIDGYISESIAIRYRGFTKDKQGKELEEEGKALVYLAARVVDELQVFESAFKDLILGKFHIPSIAATIYVNGLVVQIEMFIASLKASSSPAAPLDIGFAVYESVRALEELCERIDYRLGVKLKIQSWFRIFLEEFVGVSEKKIAEWVQNSVAVDDFSILNAGHSSSVLDVFISFQQQIDFILKLKWPSDEDTSMFIGKLIENIGEGLEKYANLMKQSISSDLKQQPTLQVPKSTSTSTNLSSSSTSTSAPSTPTKFKLKVRKQGPPIDPSELRVSSQSCVKLSNIDCLLQRFDDLIETIPLHFRESLRSSTSSMTKPLPSIPPSVDSEGGGGPPPIPPPRKRKAVTQIRPRVAGTLTMLHATDFHIVRPYATKVSLRICTMVAGRSHNLPSPSSGGGVGAAPSIGLELGRTVKAHQAQKMVFANGDDCGIPILLTDVDIERGLRLMVVHHIPMTIGIPPSVAATSPTGGPASTSGTDYLIAMEGFAIDHVVMTAVKNGGGGVVFGVSVAGGMVMLKLVIEQGVVASIVRNRLRYVVNRMVEDSKTVLVDKLCFDLRQRLKDASAEHKQSVIIVNNIMNLFSSEATKRSLQAPLSTAQKPTETDVDAKLAPLLDFIDGNLGIIAETILSVSLANRVVQGIWERFIDVAEGLIVPNLGDDNGLLDRKRPWEDSRVAFLGHTVEIVKEFLHADGSGLPLDQMEVETFGQLQLILKHYGWNKRDLYQKHFGEMSRFMDWSDAWLLKLLKLKGGYGDYVVDAMRRKRNVGRHLCNRSSAYAHLMSQLYLKENPANPISFGFIVLAAFVTDT